MSEQKLKTYLFSYRHDGAEWGFEVKATNLADAKARVSKMACSVYDGELVVKMPAGAGLLVRMVTMLRNLFRDCWRRGS